MEKPESLEDEADLPPPQRRSFFARTQAGVRSLNENRSRIGRPETTQQRQQSGLSTPGGAHHQRQRRGGELQRYLRQRRYAIVTRAKPDAGIFHGQRMFRHG